MRHDLQVLSLHDGNAVCSQGDWTYLRTTTTEDNAVTIFGDMRGEFDKHLRNIRNETRRAREDAYRSCGLVKVRGALGGTYWE